MSIATDYLRQRRRELEACANSTDLTAGEIARLEFDIGRLDGWILEIEKLEARPVRDFRTGPTLANVRAFIAGRSTVTTGELVRGVTGAKPKDVTNAINYLARSGEVTRLRRGCYQCS